MKELLKKIQDFQLESFGEIRSAILLSVHTDFFTVDAIDDDHLITATVYGFLRKSDNRKAVNNFIKEVNKYEHKIRK